VRTDDSAAAARAGVPWLAGLTGRCPRCRQGRIFTDWTRITDDCPNCGLDLRQADVGDGPVPFIIMIAGFLGAGLGTWVMMMFDAPVWLALLAALPALLAAVAMIRPLKGLLVSLQYHYRAGDSGGGDFGDAIADGASSSSSTPPKNG